MDRFIQSARQAVRDNNVYAALLVCMTIPDICARLESDNGKTDRHRFCAWFDRYLAKYYRRKVGPTAQELVFLSAKDCYALRCAMLHEGGSDISTQSFRDVLNRIHFTSGSRSHLNIFNDVLQLDVERFCTDMCAAAEEWLADFKSNHPEKVSRLGTLIEVFTGTHLIAPGIRMAGPDDEAY